MLVTELNSNEVIHVRTEQEAIAICQLMHDAGLKWCNNKSYLDINEWNNKYGEICYNPSKGGYSRFQWYTSKKSFTIYPASLFLEPQYEIF